MRKEFWLPRQLLMAAMIVVLFVFATTRCQPDRAIVAPEIIDEEVMVASAGVVNDSQDELIHFNNLSYVLDWAEDDSAESIRTNLNYEVTLETAYLLNASLELLPCEESSFFDLFLPAIAYAGHGITIAGESRLLVARAESLTELIPTEVGQATSAQDKYCQLHYLIAPAFDGAENLPADINLLGKTIYISGSYLADGTAESVPFVIETELAWGGFIPLSQPLDSGNDNVTVVVKRSLSTLFDDIDFASMDDATRAKSILRSLIKHTIIDVQTSD